MSVSASYVGVAPGGDLVPADREPEPVRIAVVDEHGPTRLGFALVLSRQSWVERCLTARDRNEAVQVVRRHRPSVVLLELTAFVAPTVDALKAAHPPVRILLSSRCGVAASTAARQLGVAGVLGADASHEELIASVRAVAFGEPIAPPPAVAEVEFGLTEREQQVLALLGTGATNGQIAADLNLGRDSIKKHASAIYRKLGVRNRTELARRMAEHVRTTVEPAPAAAGDLLPAAR
jgi:DNA-binding NarL/FixJ family response regulator